MNEEKPSSPWGRVRFALMAAAALAAIAYSSCGDSDINLFRDAGQSSAVPSDGETELDQARAMVDKGENAKAVALVAPVIEDETRDSNEARMLYVAAVLGKAEVGVWPAVLSVIGAQSAGDEAESKLGIDTLLAMVGAEALGLGEARVTKVDAMADALAVLLDAPAPEERQIQNSSCLLAALLAVPTLADAQTAAAAVGGALDRIASSATSGGAECPDVTLLDQTATGLVAATTNFNLVVEAAESCTFLDVEAARTVLNDVESKIALLKVGADRGCDTLPACSAAMPNCERLFPQCVRQALAVGASGAVAGDGKLATCELALHCLNPQDCFGT